uniref:Uncharacterized protein n=1 Tax=Anguilla anguilla TaxID=7936 RepID=A0A0E9S9H7_ANGAN
MIALANVLAHRNCFSKENCKTAFPRQSNAP